MALLLDCVFTGAPAGNLESFAIPGYPALRWVRTSGSTDVLVGADGAKQDPADLLGDSGIFELRVVSTGDPWEVSTDALTMEIYAVQLADTGVYGGGACSVSLAQAPSGGYSPGSATGVRSGWNDTEIRPQVGAGSSASLAGEFGSRAQAAGAVVMSATHVSAGFVTYRFNDGVEGSSSTYSFPSPTAVLRFATSRTRITTRIRLYDGGDPSGGGGGGGEPEPEPYAHWWRDFANTDVESKT